MNLGLSLILLFERGNRTSDPCVISLACYHKTTGPLLNTGLRIIPKHLYKCSAIINSLLVFTKYFDSFQNFWMCAKCAFIYQHQSTKRRIEGRGFDPQPPYTKSRKKMVPVAPLLTLGIER